MTNPTTPQRLVLIATPRNVALTLSSISNAINDLTTPPEKILILYDSLVSEKTDMDYLLDEAKKIGQGNIQVEKREIPVINELLDTEIPYTPHEFDCILVPAMQLHLALLIHKLTESARKNEIRVFFLCHSSPDGKSRDWKVLGRNLAGKWIIKSVKTDKLSDNELSWILAGSEIEWNYFKEGLNRSILNEFIDFEKQSPDGPAVTNSLLELTEDHVLSVNSKNIGAKVGEAFEIVSSVCFREHDSIKSVVINVEFMGGMKAIVPHTGEVVKAKREEDIIALTKNGNLIYASCKFKGRANSTIKTPQKITEKMQEEISRLDSLILPITFPKERIVKMLITTTPAMQLAGPTGDVIVTNLHGLNGELKNL